MFCFLQPLVLATAGGVVTGVEGIPSPPPLQSLAQEPQLRTELREARGSYPSSTASRVVKTYLPGFLQSSGNLDVFATVGSHSTSINNKTK